MKKKLVVASISVFVVALLAALGSLLLWQPEAVAAAGDKSGIPWEGGIWQWGYLAAAIATGMSAMGAGYAVGAVGSAAVGALAEKPELFGRLVILIGLAEGIAIYGIIISVLILNSLLP